MTTISLRSNSVRENVFVNNAIYGDARHSVSNSWNKIDQSIPFSLNKLYYASPVEKSKVITLGYDDIELKRLYGKEVYRFLYEKYKSCGGIDKGKGFKNENDMISNIPIWRLRTIKNRIVSVMMFKVKKYGKKMVAYACEDQLSADERKSDFTYMLDKSYAELSDGLLVTILKSFSQHLHHYVLKAEHLIKDKVIYPLNNDCSENSIPESSRRLFLKIKEQWPELLRYCYIRKIGNEYKLKVLMGAPEKSYFKNHLAFHV
jgi:hypothetical protein